MANDNEILGDEADISMFTPIDAIEVKDLEKGTQVRISYEPNRLIGQRGR